MKTWYFYLTDVTEHRTHYWRALEDLVLARNVKSAVNKVRRQYSRFDCYNEAVLADADGKVVWDFQEAR